MAEWLPRVIRCPLVGDELDFCVFSAIKYPNHLIQRAEIFFWTSYEACWVDYIRILLKELTSIPKLQTQSLMVFLVFILSGAWLYWHRSRAVEGPQSVLVGSGASVVTLVYGCGEEKECPQPQGYTWEGVHRRIAQTE